MPGRSGAWGKHLVIRGWWGRSVPNPRSRAACARHLSPMGKAANLVYCARELASGVALPEANWVGMGWGRGGG
jgi:hypothetical protein